MPAPGPSGLTAAQVEERTRQGEVNHHHTKTSRSLGSIARANVFTLFNTILTTAIVVVLIVGDWRDAVFGGVMVLNAIIGIAAEYRAKKTLDSLAIVDAPHSLVWRDGEEREILSEDVVRGDIIELRLGDQVPVDGIVQTSHSLDIDESLLTGESVPIRKKQGDRVLGGTAVVSGDGLIEATVVGNAVYAHTLTEQVRRFTRTTSEIQQGINRVLRVISWLIVPVTALIVWSQIRLDPLSGGWRHALVLAIAAVVGMIPQGLVLLTSMNFALGAAALARRKVLVNELPAVEVLARVDALCVDKTGTLTTGGVSVDSMIPLGAGDSGDRIDEGAARALLTLNASTHNATAEAIVAHLKAQALEVEPADLSDNWSVPFNSTRKWSGFSDGQQAWVLGAPEMTVTDANVLDHVTRVADQGLRVVVLSCAPAAPLLMGEELPQGLQPNTLIVLREQIRPDAADTMKYFRRQGVRVRVISGDNPATVQAIASVASLREDQATIRGMDARTLPEDMDSDAFVQAVMDHDVFGRVTPEQKRAMVRALQSRGHTVAMTGDGVNDALALKDADLGIAMGSGARATKAVAQIVLVDGAFAALPGVVAEGRRIMANMERVSALFLAKTVYASLIAVICALAAWHYPFLPRHFTYIDALTIGIPAFFIALGPNRRRYVSGYLKRVLGLAVPSGCVLAAAALTAYWMVGVGQVEGQTAAALSLMCGALWLLSITARPVNSWRAGLIALMLTCAVAGVFIPFVRNFFALEWPAAHDGWVILACGLTACILIEAAHRAYSLRHQRKAETDGAPLD